MMWAVDYLLGLLTGYLLHTLIAMLVCPEYAKYIKLRIKGRQA